MNMFHPLKYDIEILNRSVASSIKAFPLLIQLGNPYFMGKLSPMENIATRPPTTLYIPKSSITNAFRLTRLVYKLTSIKKSIRKYNNSVFWAMRLLF